MIESEYIALLNFMIDYPVIIGYLEGEITKLEGSSNASTQCHVTQMKHWSRRMREFKFVAVTLCLLDNDKRSKIFSKAAQNDNDLALDYPTSLQGSNNLWRLLNVVCLGASRSVAHE